MRVGDSWPLEEALIAEYLKTRSSSSFVRVVSECFLSQRSGRGGGKEVAAVKTCRGRMVTALTKCGLHARARARAQLQILETRM